MHPYTPFKISLSLRYLLTTSGCEIAPWRFLRAEQSDLAEPLKSILNPWAIPSRKKCTSSWFG